MSQNKATGGNITSKQKIGLGILSILGIAALLFGLWQFLYNIKKPFVGRGTGLKSFKTQEQQELENLIALQSKDTDHDGLSDFDELYQYKTSPYLEDSDSDGFLDKQEIDSGNDPNCPAGQDCMATEQSASSELSLTNSNVGSLTNSNAGLELLQGQATPEAIRQMLRASGMSDEVLSKIDDKTLMELYQETLAQTPLPEELSNLIPSSNTNLPSDVSKLSAEEIRNFFRQAGVPEEVLSRFDDETLRKMLEESINK
jgi:hypothetical protein